MNKQFETGLMWFRRDLRVMDNAALCLAMTTCRQVHCVFIFDQDILVTLPRADRRVAFIQAALVELDEDLRRLDGTPGAGLIVHQGRADEEIVALAKALQVQSVFAARDYEPQAQARDARVLGDLADAGIALHTCKDHVIFEGREILTQSGTPYGVFTPYKNKWLATVTSQHLRGHEAGPFAAALAPRPAGLQQPVPALAAIGFEKTNLDALKIPTGASGGRQLFEDFFKRMDRATMKRVISRPSKARATSVCTCALARSPSASWRPLPCSGRFRAAGVRPSGWGS